MIRPLLFYAAIAGIAEILIASAPARPTSRFVVQCQPAPSLSCTFTSVSDGSPIKAVWLWGDGRSDARIRRSGDSTWRTVKNAWSAPGRYHVRLTVMDSIGGNSYSTQWVDVPRICACVDTVRIHDTVTVTPPVVIPPPSQAPPGETWAELPRVYLDTRMPVTTGVQIPVAVGGNLQAAIDSARPGDVITLANGGTWTGNYTLPPKSGNGWVIIRPQNMTALPPEGVRINPMTVGPLPRILSSNNMGGITATAGAHHYRLVGLDVGPTPGVDNTGLIRLGTGYETTVADLPHDLVLDRMYIHGTPTGNVRRCVALNSASTAVIDSYLSECHEKGSDSQAIGGWNGSGPFKIVNNYLEAASENIMFGGADPVIPNLIPSDIEIRRNHITKQLSWKGQGWVVKNLFELKNAARVLVEGNVLENNWADAQGGSAVNLKSVNQGGACPWCTTRDVTFRLNLIRNVGSGFNLTGTDPGASVAMARVTIADNIIDGINVGAFNGDGRGVMINSAPEDLIIAHNSIPEPTNSAVTFGGPPQTPPVRLAIRDNVIGSGQYGVKGPSMSVANTFAAFMPGGRFVGNVIITDDPAGYPRTTYFTFSRAALFTPSTMLLRVGSPYRGAASDGKDVGANADAVSSATAGVVAQ